MLCIHYAHNNHDNGNHQQRQNRRGVHHSAWLAHVILEAVTGLTFIAERTDMACPTPLLLLVYARVCYRTFKQKPRAVGWSRVSPCLSPAVSHCRDFCSTVNAKEVVTSHAQRRSFAYARLAAQIA